MEEFYETEFMDFIFIKGSYFETYGELGSMTEFISDAYYFCTSEASRRSIHLYMAL